MKTVVYLHLDTGNNPSSSGSSTTEEDDHEKEAACPMCALSQPPTHWHCLLPGRETFKVEAVPLLTEALATSCSVCTRTPPGSLKMCSHCRAVVYCSEECQLQDWRQGQHASRCYQRQVSAGRKLIKSVAKLDLPCLKADNFANAGSAGRAGNAEKEGFNGGSGQQAQSYRGHQQQFFNRLQQQQTSSRNGGSAFATYKYKTQMPTNGHTAGAIPKTTAPVSAPSTLTTPATPTAATTLPCANTAPPLPPPLPAKANKSAVEAKYQLKPIPINEAMQHHELKDVTDGPWRKGGIKEVPKEVPQFPKEFLNEKEKEEVVAKQEHYQEQQQQQQKLPNSSQGNTVNTDQQKRKFLVPLIFGPTPPPPQSTTPESTAVSAVQKGKSASSPAPASLEIPCTSDPTPVSSLEAEKYFDGVVSKLPRYQLTSGKAYHLMPLYLEESVDRKRVHFHVAYRDFIGKLMVEIGKVVAQGVPVEPASIEPGDILLVKYDGEWFRAQVLRLTSTAFYVEYFDFGNRKYVDRREVAAGDFFRTLPAAISVQRLPPTAIRVQVRNVPSFQQFNLLQRLINEAIHKLSLLKLYVVEYCPEADSYTVQFDEI